MSPGAGAAAVVLEAGGVLTAPDGPDLFPVAPDECGGGAIAFLAGDPIAHRQTLGKVAEAGRAR